MTMQTINDPFFRQRNLRTYSLGSATQSILAILALFIIGVILLFCFTRNIEDAAREQLDAIRNQDFQTAYHLTSKKFQHGNSLEHFKNYINQFPNLNNYKDVTFKENKTLDGVTLLKGQIDINGGGKIAVEFDMVKEDSEWKIQDIKLYSANRLP